MKSKLVIVFAIIAAITAIMFNYLSGDRPAPKDMIARMAGFRDRMCACKDAPCKDALDKEIAAWSKGLSGAAPSDAEVAKFNELSDAMTRCMTAGAAAGSAGPEAPASSARP